MPPAPWAPPRAGRRRSSARTRPAPRCAPRRGATRLRPFSPRRSPPATIGWSRDAVGCARALLRAPVRDWAADPDGRGSGRRGGGARWRSRAEGGRAGLAPQDATSDAVRLALRGRTAVLRAARAMQKDLRGAGLAPTGFLVQPMAEAGVELLVGVTHDRLFGPVVACAAGGTAAELLADASVRLAPLSERDVHEMPRALAMFPLLAGHRGAPSCRRRGARGRPAPDQRAGRRPSLDRGARLQSRRRHAGGGGDRRHAGPGAPAAAAGARRLAAGVLSQRARSAGFHGPDARLRSVAATRTRP